MLWWVRVGAFNLNKTLRAYGLVAASSLVQVRRIIEKTNRALCCILVKECLDGLPINVGVPRQLDLSRHNID